VPAAIVLTTETLHVTLLPPPYVIPLHWFTEVTSWLEVVTVVVQPKGGSTPAAAKHAVAVTVDEEAPVEVTELSTVMVQVTSNPAPVGKAGGSHCAAEGALAAADAVGAPAKPPRTSMARAVAATTAMMRQRCAARLRPTPPPTGMGIPAKRCEVWARFDARAASMTGSLKNPEINTVCYGRPELRGSVL